MSNLCLSRCRVHLLKTRDDFYYPLEIKIGSCVASRHPITRVFMNSFFYILYPFKIV